MAKGKEMTSLLLSIGIIGGVLFFGAQYARNLFSDAPNGGVFEGGRSQDTFADVDGVPQGLFRYGGSTIWAPIRDEIDEALLIEKSGFDLSYIDPDADPPGSSAGIKMLLDNQLAFSQSSRSLKPEEYEIAEQKGFKLKEIPVALDGLAIAVHPDLEVAGLTVAQLKDIYLGKIKNWQEVGGPNVEIIPYTRNEETVGTVDFFIESILGGETFGDNKKYVSSTAEALRLVSENLGGVYYASAPEVVPQCSVKTLALGQSESQLVKPYKEPFQPLSNCPLERNVLNNEAFKTGAYPIMRSLFVIVKQNDGVEEEAGMAYANLLLTEQGQDLIEKAGFVRIR
ncbi:phosphate ABC transporter substrate-binding protein, PhoT family [[Leptolyngbya] sp. PCC 7376]|uniref:PstS family phosphate ABC transporter substrate-binding protein n=1 Tax=[Leptolyngbya] sp. PCC 7376 TaxID=111781 RepID=UPI00029EE418|nr:PstS family phosphate ABC transporter substrate-binding protein [[Leptolyngbya] sp. PCC 7376]AFY38890.1 phosphate ABC transporter substrate-binding protein, PhoT family [[Leptolyngbya] sp. PCC 7376]